MGKPKESPERGRWSSPRKTDVVLRLLRGEDLDALARELSATICDAARSAHEGDDQRSASGGHVLMGLLCRSKMSLPATMHEGHGLVFKHFQITAADSLNISFGLVQKIKCFDET